jgi:GNAT superfamily N-acetyltransferase
MRELTDWHHEMYQRPLATWGPLESDYDRDLDTVDPSLFWVAVHDSRVIGLVGLLIKTNPFSKPIEAEIEPIIVTREFRGKGIGERLLEKAITEARARGARRVTVKPVTRNIKTIHFFYKHGFTLLGYVELFMDLFERSRKPGPGMFGCDFDM